MHFLFFLAAFAAILIQREKTSLLKVSDHQHEKEDPRNEHNMMKAISQKVSCTCGKVQLAIDSPSALRLVCYCKDCRGYYNMLNHLHSHNHAVLDPWGGVDYTQIYPSEIKVLKGQELIHTCLIRPKSPIRRVYASCCDTPLFTVGSNSALLNTHLLPNEEDKPDVRFRIIGRNSLNGPSGKPSMSWSVPLNWLWVMGMRIQRDKMEPVPVDISQPTVLENFKEG